MSKPTFNVLAERNFTIAARILTDASVQVHITDQPEAGACAWWQSETKRVFLNDAHPRTDKPVESLIYNRGKLYHELAHKLFTNAYDYRHELEAKAKDKGLFDRIRQTLEDGYIEQRIAKQWQGATPYIRSLLGHVLKSDKSKFGALALFVRTFVWRDKAAKQAWGRWEKLIKQAVHSDSKGVCDAAFEIAEALAQEREQGQGNGEGQGEQQKPQPSQSEEQGQGQEQGKGEEQAESEEGEEGEATGTEQDEGEAEGEVEGEGESDEDEESEATEGEQTISGKGGSDEGEQDGGNSAGGEAEIAEDIEALVQALVEEAMLEAEAEAEAEYNEIMMEIAQYAAEQDFASPDEEATSNRIAEVLRSTLVESNRQKWIETRRCGTFNSRRIVNAISGGTCLRQRQESEDLPHIALLLDVSGSMAGNKLYQLSQAGRVLNGAVAQVSRKAMVAAFGTCTYVLETVPVQGLGTRGSTDTARALDVATQWLQAEEAKRGLIVIATDGQPDEMAAAEQAFNRAKAEGYFVLGVWIGGYTPRENVYCHASLTCKDIAKLPELLTEPLRLFVAGAY
jgi:Mg-chelatase subunit ChlD